jgi:hypothetical protein
VIVDVVVVVAFDGAVDLSATLVVDVDGPSTAVDKDGAHVHGAVFDNDHVNVHVKVTGSTMTQLLRGCQSAYTGEVAARGRGEGWPA